MVSSAVLGRFVVALYPFIVFAGLHAVDPRTLAALLLGVLLLRRRRIVGPLLSTLRWTDSLALALPVVLALAVMTTNDETLLLMYPAAVNASLLLLFAMSLVHPPSAIERIARLHEPDLPARAVRYTRNVTLLWCAFFVANGAIAACTALYASRETWTLYNGFIAYLLMGLLFAGERVLRPRILRHA